MNVFREHHRLEHARLRGTEPVYTASQHGAAGKAWKDLASVRSEDEGKAIITAALADGFAVDPWVIVRQQNKYAAGTSAPRRRGYQPQATTPALAALTEQARRRGATVDTAPEEAEGAAQ